MKHGAALHSRVLPEICGRPEFRARHGLDIPEPLKGRLPIDVANHFEPGNHDLAIMFCAEIARLDTRLIKRVGRADRQPAARVGSALGHRHAETRVGVQGHAWPVNRQRHYIELNIGATVTGMGCAGKTAHLSGSDRQWPPIEQQPLQAHFCKPIRTSDLIIERHATLETNNHARLVMVLQVFANFGRIGQHRNTVLAQQRRWSDP